MTELIETGKISTRGQVAIPVDIRKKMQLKEGQKILFVLAGDTLMVKKVNIETFAEITKPLKEAAKKAGLKEEDVVDIVHRVRQKR